MPQALLAIASLLIGVALSEWIRRSNRIESYAPLIFQKRLDIYEDLWKRVRQAGEIADTVIEDSALTAQSRHDFVSEVVLGIAQFCDDKSFYLNEEVTIQCCTVFMGVEDIQAEADSTTKENMVSEFRNKYRKTLEIIRAEAGLKRIDKLVSTITQTKYSSDVIEYYRQVRSEQRRLFQEEDDT